MKKTVKFADGILPGYGSSYSDSEQKPETSPSLLNVSEKRKKKLNKRKKHPSSENNEKKTVSMTLKVASHSKKLKKFLFYVESSTRIDTVPHRNEYSS